MQTENLAKKSHKQFYILLNTNQTKLYTYSDLLKENPLLRKISQLSIKSLHFTFLNDNFRCNSH